MRKKVFICCFLFIFLTFSYSQEQQVADTSAIQSSESVESLEKELKELSETDYERKLVVMGKLMILYGQNEADAIKAIPLLEETISIMEMFFEPSSEIMLSLYQNAMDAFAAMQDNKKVLLYFEKYAQANGSDEISKENPKELLSLYSVIGMGYYESGKYDTAIKYFQKSLAVCESAGAETEAARIYSNIGACYHSKSEYENSLFYNNKSLIINQKLYGENSFQTLEPLVNIGNVYLSKADYGNALTYYEKALSLQKDNSIEENNITAIIYNNIGLVHSNRTEYDKALENLEKATNIRKKLFGEEHSETAASYTNIGEVVLQKGDYDSALNYFSKALEIRKKILGNHPETAVAYQNLALVYNEKNEYSKALENYEQARSMLVALVGENHDNVAMLYSNISKTYQEMDDFENALVYGDKALSIRKTLFGEIHPDVAASYMNKGVLYRQFGDYENAVFYIDKALSVYTHIFGSKHNLIASCYNNLGTVYQDKGQLDEALAYFQKAHSLRIELFGEQSNQLSPTYLNIGNIYVAKGDNDNALSYYENARILSEKTLGANHSQTAVIYNNIAIVYQNKKDYDGAVRYYRKALNSYIAIYGSEHTSVAMAYGNLGTAYRDKGNYELALLYLKKAKNIDEKLLGENHPETAGNYANLALIYASKKDYDNAISYDEKALAVYENSFGSEHRNVALICFNIGLLHCDKKNFLLADEYWNKCINASKSTSDYVATIERMKKIIEITKNEELVREALQTGIEATEKARLDLSSIKTNLLSMSLPLYYHGVQFEASHNNIAKAFEYSESLRNRGFLEQLGFETALKLKGVTDEERKLVRKLSERITQARKEIEKQNELGSKRNNAKLVNAGKQLAEAEKQLAELDSELSNRIPVYAQLRNPKPVTAESVQKWCKEDRTVLEYVLYEQMAYCIVIDSDKINIVPIDSEYDYLKAAYELRNSVYKKRQNLFAGKRSGIQKYRSELYAKLIEPVLPYLSEKTKSFLIVPDGVLSSIPFDILGNEADGVLCEKYAISFSPSVSVSMLRERKKRESFSMLEIGNAVYDSGEDFSLAKNTKVSEYYRRNIPKWENIPGTEKEISNIKNTIFSNEKIDVYVGKNSTESLVKKLSSSGELANYTQILLACHGYFDSNEPECSSLVFSEVSGVVADSDDDGYLTVSELALLNMDAEFLNLSACQTGLSAEKKADGMVGLTRSCIVAGASNVGVTLWEVDDNATCEFQRIFYGHIKAGVPYESAYQSAKQEMKDSEQWSDPVYWAGFVLYE